MPYEHVEGAYPLGRWLSDQRRAYRAGQMSGEHAAELEKLGIVWDTAHAAFAENLAAARAYFERHGTLAAPRHATALDKAVGQWLTNVRRPGGLGKDPDRAGRRAEKLAGVVPGVTLHGEDGGRWLATQRRDFSKLNGEQQRRLGELGVMKAARARKAPAKAVVASGRARAAGRSRRAWRRSRSTSRGRAGCRGAASCRFWPMGPSIALASGSGT